jgi:hypothetical protein
VDLCPLIEQKIKNLGLFSKNWVSGGLGIKWEFWGFGWPAVGGFGGEWPAVVFWWWVRRWVVVGVGGFGFREERTEEGVSGFSVRPKGK